MIFPDFKVTHGQKSPLCYTKVTPENPLGSNFQNPSTEPEQMNHIHVFCVDILIPY